MDLECSFTEEPADEEIFQADLVVRLENSSEPVTPPRHTRGSNTLRSYLTTSSKQSAEEISKMINAQKRSLFPSRRRSVRASKYKAKHTVYVDIKNIYCECN